MSKILVTGGRDYTDGSVVFNVLDALHSKSPITELTQGGATGADALAKNWAQLHQVPVREYKADWATFGNAAGAMRNSEMLRFTNPDFVVAFPGGSGTLDMIWKARKAGLRIMKVS